jgi:hypothetical protein
LAALDATNLILTSCIADRQNRIGQLQGQIVNTALAHLMAFSVEPFYGLRL